MSHTLYIGDCLAVLKDLPDNSVDACVTDPPYGLSKEPDIAEVMRHWVAGDKYEHKHAGFMGKSWDSFVPGPEYWREVYRVLKPGAHICVFSGTRTWDLMSSAIRFAGFENRDTIASFGGPPGMAWVQGQGFPKSTDISKRIDKEAGAEREIVGRQDYSAPDIRGNSYDQPQVAERERLGVAITAPATDAAKQWEGWGTALKPAWEVILVFRKPLEKGLTVAQNVQRWGCGALNIDATRIATDRTKEREYDKEPLSGKTGGDLGSNSTFGIGLGVRRNDDWLKTGRFPANVILDEIAAQALDEQCKTTAPNMHHAGNKGSKVVDAGDKSIFGIGLHKGAESQYQDDKLGASRFFFNVKADKQGPFISREELIREFQRGNFTHVNDVSESKEMSEEFCHAVVQALVPLDNTQPNRFFYCPKASTSERNKGLEDLPEQVAGMGDDRPSGQSMQRLDGRPTRTARNVHPTVKPVRLMEYLCKLICPPGGTVIDPFMGSGTTGIAAKMLGLNFIGIELSSEYFNIAKARIESWEVETPKEPAQMEIEA